MAAYRETDAKLRLFRAQLELIKGDQLSAVQRQALQASQYFHLVTWYRAFVDEVASHFGVALGCDGFTALCELLAQRELESAHALLLSELEQQPQSWLAQALNVNRSQSSAQPESALGSKVQLIGSTKRSDLEIMCTCAVELEKQIADFRNLMQEW